MFLSHYAGSTSWAVLIEHMEELGMKKYATEKYEKMQMKKYAYGTVCQCKKYANEKACKGINDIFPLTGGIWLLLVSSLGRGPKVKNGRINK